MFDATARLLSLLKRESITPIVLMSICQPHLQGHLIVPRTVFRKLGAPGQFLNPYGFVVAPAVAGLPFCRKLDGPVLSHEHLQEFPC